MNSISTVYTEKRSVSARVPLEKLCAMDLICVRVDVPDPRSFAVRALRRAAKGWLGSVGRPNTFSRRSMPQVARCGHICFGRSATLIPADCSSGATAA